jgi:hypothetical protein
LSQAIDWSSISLHVTPHEVPLLNQTLRQADAAALRRAAAPLRRRLLWASIYGECHLLPGEGGEADAFDTLMEVLARPRVHFRPGEAHTAPRAPELLKDLDGWLRRAPGGEVCARRASQELEVGRPLPVRGEVLYYAYSKVAAP